MKTLIKLLGLTLMLTFKAITVNAQDTNYARRIIRDLTSERMHGRGYSFHGDSIAASYLRNEMRRLELKPLNSVYYQPYTFSTFSMEGPVMLKIGNKILQPYYQYRIPAWSQSSWGKYKVLTIPVETIVDAEKLKKFLHKNNDLLREVFVYIDASTDCSMLSDSQKKSFDNILSVLRRRNPFNSKGIIVGVNQLSTYSPAYTDYEHGYAFIEVLSSCVPKKMKSIDCSFFTQFHPSYSTQNVCGYVEGEVDTMIVFTAHYDHLGTMGDSVIFHGAHDNASGVAAVLDLARMAAAEKPHYTQVFYLFSGEEAGLQGSRYAVEHPLFDFSKVRLLVNIDMFCGGSEGLMVFNATAENVQPYFERLQNLNQVLEIVPEIRPRENRPNSDHYHFAKLMPTLFILTMGGEYGGYHDPDDICDRCGLEHYLNYLTLISSLGLK